MEIRRLFLALDLLTRSLVWEKIPSKAGTFCSLGKWRAKRSPASSPIVSKLTSIQAQLKKAAEYN